MADDFPRFKVCVALSATLFATLFNQWNDVDSICDACEPIRESNEIRIVIGNETFCIVARGCKSSASQAANDRF